MEILAPNWMSIVELSYNSWWQLDRKIFQSAWIACGYMQWDDMPHETKDPPITMEDARQVLDVFGKLGTGTPQWCTVYEWQIQDRLEIIIGSLGLLFLFLQRFFWDATFFFDQNQTAFLIVAKRRPVAMLSGLLALLLYFQY